MSRRSSKTKWSPFLFPPDPFANLFGGRKLKKEYLRKCKEEKEEKDKKYLQDLISNPSKVIIRRPGCPEKVIDKNKRSRMFIHEFESEEEIIASLRDSKRMMENFFRQRRSSLAEIVSNAVAGNTFRAFAHLPKQPSKIFREWAISEFTSQHERVLSIRTRTEYGRWLESSCERLNEFWKSNMGASMNYGPRRKLPNLLMKQFVLWREINEDQRFSLLHFLHVPLDKYSLVALRRCYPHLRIRSSSTMSFVDGREKYENIQQAIQSICTRANLPAIYFDILTWDKAHLDNKDSYEMLRGRKF
jgi:hypothetical protein